MATQKTKKFEKPIWTAMALLITFIVLGLASTFVIYKLFPSNVELKIKQAGITATVLGGGALLLITTWLYSSLYLRILKSVAPVIVIGVLVTWITLTDMQNEHEIDIDSTSQPKVTDNQPADINIDGLLATLNLSTDPQGAEVFIDFEFKGITPIRVSLKPGMHTVSLSLNAYLPWEAAMDLDGGIETPLFVPLRPIKE